MAKQSLRMEETQSDGKEGGLKNTKCNRRLVQVNHEAMTTWSKEMNQIPELPISELTTTETISINEILFKIRSNTTQSIENLKAYLPKHSFFNLKHNKREITIFEYTSEETEVYYQHLRSLPGKLIQTYKNSYHKQLTINKDATPNSIFCSPADRLYFVYAINDTIYLWLSPKGKKNEKHLIRIIREILLRDAESKGEINLHAASFEINQKGCLIIGDSGSGKTSLLLYFLRRLNAKYLSNDRVLYCPKSGRLRTIPLAIRIAPQAALSWKGLKEKISSQENLVRKNNPAWDTIQLLNTSSDHNNKIELAPIELCTVAQSEQITQTKGYCAIFPKIVNEKKPFLIKPVTDKNIKKILMNQVYTPNDPQWIEEWIEKRKHHLSKEKSIKTLSSKLKNMRLYELQFSFESLNAKKNNSAVISTLLSD